MSKTFYLTGGAILIAFFGFLAVRSSSDDFIFKGNKGLIADAAVKSDIDLQKWKEFSPPSNKFKVLFPAVPQHAQEKLQDPNTKENRQYEMYVSEKDDGTIFMISAITMLDNTNPKIDDTVLKNVINDLLASNPKNKVNKIEKGTYKGNSSLEFSIRNDQVNIDGRAFLVGNTLYILTSAAKIENYHKPEFDLFANSFELQPK